MREIDCYRAGIIGGGVQGLARGFISRLPRVETRPFYPQAGSERQVPSLFPIAADRAVLLLSAKISTVSKAAGA